MEVESWIDPRAYAMKDLREDAGGIGKGEV